MAVDINLLGVKKKKKGLITSLKSGSMQEIQSVCIVRPSYMYLPSMYQTETLLSKVS